MALTVLEIGYSLAPVGPDAVGGAEQVLAMLDEALEAAGHRSIVVAPEGSSCRGALWATPAERGLLDGAARARAIRHHREAIARALAEHDVDLVHLHGVDFEACLPPPGPPALVTLHLPPSFYGPSAFAPERPWTFLHCVSAAQRAACPAGAVLLPEIPNGVRLDRYQPSGTKRDFALALGRICPEKGYHLALEAAARAAVPMLLGGEVQGYPEHRRYFREAVVPLLDATRRFLGPVPLARKRALLAAARCLLVPSLAQETSSLVAMEALASGTPVIAFPAGALAEIVEHNRTGFLVDTPEEMADAIRHTGTIDPRVCRRAAEERFSAERMTSDYLAAYERVLRATRCAALLAPVVSMLGRAS